VPIDDFVNHVQFRVWYVDEAIGKGLLLGGYNTHCFWFNAGVSSAVPVYLPSTIVLETFLTVFLLL
jgi:hypothetical protein